MRGARFILAGFCAGLLAVAGGASAQSIDFASHKSSTPLEIYADQGLELAQESRVIIARGNAKAVRGNATLTADVLVAHYRQKAETPADSVSRQKNAKGQPGAGPKAAPAGKVQSADAAAGDAKADKDEGGGSEVWRVEAHGHVVITTPTQKVTAEYGDYNIDEAVVVLTGNNLRLTTPTDVVTARDTLEYWEGRQQAVARGDAVATRGDDRLQGDVLVADFGQGADQKTTIQKAHAYDNVILTTPREIVTGDRGDYMVETGIVTVTGSVKMTRDNNQLNGGYAIVNLNTGISRLFPNPPGGGKEQRVKGLFAPQPKGQGGQDSVQQNR